jgi:hypothetical protein
MESDQSFAVTRRTLMRLAAAALPAGVVRAAQPAGPVMTKLSSYMSGPQLVRAVALGYDVGARVLTALRPGVFETHKSTHSIGGVFGAPDGRRGAVGQPSRLMRWTPLEAPPAAPCAESLKALSRDQCPARAHMAWPLLRYAVKEYGQVEYFRVGDDTARNLPTYP